MQAHNLGLFPVPQGNAIAVDMFSPALVQVTEAERDYLVRHLGWRDFTRQDEYQRLRTDTFVDQLNWKIPVDSQGRERDRYDCMNSKYINVYGVYGKDEQQEHLLGGIRIFSLQDWSDSMVVNEFRTAGLIPDSVIHQLKVAYDCRELLELTRFCVRRGRWHIPSSLSNKAFNCAIARDLTYAGAYNLVEETGRQKALALVDFRYLRVMKRSHFILEEIYTGDGVTLTVIDLTATIHSIRQSGDNSRANRMLASCTSWWKTR